MKRSLKSIKEKPDLVGMFASGLCAIHCAITPFIFVAKPFLNQVVGSSELNCAHAPLAWRLFDFFFLFVSLLAVGYSAKNSDRLAIKRTFWISWSFLFVGLVTAKFFGHALMYIGSFALVATHFINFRYCRACLQAASESNYAHS